MAGDWQPGEDGTFGGAVEEYDAAGYLRIDAGAVDPLTGLSHQEQAHRALNRHRSQGMAFVPEPGPHYFYYRLEHSDVPTAQPEHSFFDGLDTDLTGLAASDLPESLAVEGPAGDPLRARNRRRRRVPPARARRGGRPPAGLPRRARRRLVADLAEAGPDPATAALTRHWTVCGPAATRCSPGACGCALDCALSSPYASPGDTVTVDVRFWNGGPEPVTVQRPGPRRPRRLGGGRTAPEPAAAEFAVTVPLEEPPTTPYWLRAARGPFAYVWPPDDPDARGRTRGSGRRSTRRR